MRLVPVIVTNVATGEETRYASVKEAAAALGVPAAMVSQACVIGHRCKGHLIRREDEFKISVKEK